MFRKRQNLTLAVAVPIVESAFKSKDDGTCERVIVESDRKLPPVANYDLTTLLRAGVPLEEVDTRVIGCRKFVYSEKEQENEE